MNFDTLTIDIRDDAIAVLTLNQPDSMNAVSTAMIEELPAAIAQVADPDAGVRCLVMTGAGRGFCAGANLSDPGMERQLAAAPEDRDVGIRLEKSYHPLLLQMRDLPFPFVTAVNGAAAGIGMSFALMGDIVVAGKSAYFLQAFRHIGLVPDGGSTWLLPRLVGRARAIELSLLGERLPAEKALDWGLINRVVEDDALMDEALKLATTLATGPTQGLKLIRQAYWSTFENSYEEQLHAERMFQREAGRSEDFITGVQAFRNKEKPKYSGK